MSSNEEIRDAFIRHQIRVLKYASGITNRQLKKLAATEEELYRALVLLVSESPGRLLNGKAGIAWQKELITTVESIRSGVWQDITDDIVTELSAFSTSEVLIASSTIQDNLPVILGLTTPPVNKLISIVKSQPFQGKTLKQWLVRTSSSDVARIVNAAKVGVVQGLTPTEIARQIVGTKRSRKGAVARKAFIDTESVLLTVTNGIQQEVRQALYASNKDVIKKELFVNTLDSRTTLTCIAAGEANDFGLGKGVYPVGRGRIPPLHFRCRSGRVPYVDPENIGDRPFNPTTERILVNEFAKANGLKKVNSRDKLPRGFKTKYDKFARAKKRELIGQLPGDVSYGDFLRKQSKDFQEEVLGVARAELFRKGDLSLTSFVSRSGETLTLDQLKRKT